MMDDIPEYTSWVLEENPAVAANMGSGGRHYILSCREHQLQSPEMPLIMIDIPNIKDMLLVNNTIIIYQPLYVIISVVLSSVSL